MSAELVLTFVNAAADLLVAVAIAGLFRYRRDELTLYLFLAFSTWFLNWVFDGLNGLGVALPHVVYYNLSTFNSMFLWLAAHHLDPERGAHAKPRLWRDAWRNPATLASGAIIAATIGLWFALPGTRAFAFPELGFATMVSLFMGLAVYRFIRPSDRVLAFVGLGTFMALAALVVGYILLELGWLNYRAWYLPFKLVSVLGHLVIIYILAHIIARGLWRRLVAHQEERERLALEQQRANTLSVLSSGTVHHFHNKLLAIRTGLRFLQGRMGVEQAHSLKIPLLLKSVDQAFALSQQLAGTLRTARESEFVAVDLSGVLMRAAENMEERRPPGFLVELHDESAASPDAPWLVRGVPTFVQMAFENLVANAFDAAPPSRREGRLVIRLTRSDDGRRARLSFEDDGTGVPEAVRHQVFVPFFTTKEDAGGTGFGLYWSRRLVEAMGGQLDLAWTEVGAGARFVIDLPLHHKEADAGPPPREASVPDADGD